MSDVSGSSRALRALLLCAIAAVTGACGAEGGTPPTMTGTFDCARNEQQACACAGGVQGVQRCGADRMWGECMCPGPTVAPPPADAGGVDAELDVSEPVRCASGTTRCGESCVDLVNDPRNCGACGNRCADTGVCLASRCEVSCSADLTRCGSSCADTRNDPRNCGACGAACGAGQDCVRGTCAPRCGTGSTACGATCVSLATDALNCGMCGTRCAAGQTCASGACRSPAASVQVTWEFPGLWQRASGETWLPTYLLHLYRFDSTITSPVEMHSACATLVNAGSSPQGVTLEARSPSLGAMGMNTVTVPAGGRTRACVEPGWDLPRLYANRTLLAGSLEVYARLTSGTELSRVTRGFSALPGNGVVWNETSDMGEGGTLATTFVTRNSPAVLALRRGAEARSRFGSFGASPYERGTYQRTANIGVGIHQWEGFYLERGERLDWALRSVTGGSDADIDVYLFDAATYASWAAGTATSASAVWRDNRAGRTGSFTAPAAGFYRIVLFNTPDNFVSRDVAWTRSNTRSDVAYDAMVSIFDELRARSTTYVHISATDYEGLQEIRTPDDTVAMRAANCIDGSLAFASVLESIGMQPVIFLVPGHAFVGVRAGPGSALIWPIETTMVGDRSRSAYQAMDYALTELSMPGFAVDIAEARRAGIQSR